MTPFFTRAYMDFNYLVIEGNIGAGKTSLAHKIAADSGARLVLEQFVDNPFLPQFYKDPDRFAFQLELAFLADRYQQLKTEIAPRDLFQQQTVSDYYFIKSLIFSKNTLKEDEYALYRKLFNIIQQQIPLPDLYIYLHVNTENLLKNIKKRGRSYESNIQAEYLKKIEKGYFDFIKTRKDLVTVVIDVNNIDFVNKESDYLLLKDAIFGQKFQKGMNMLVL
jgi:deoxyadenosine/deoxycytidine kinase